MKTRYDDKLSEYNIDAEEQVSEQDIYPLKEQSEYPTIPELDFDTHYEILLSQIYEDTLKDATDRQVELWKRGVKTKISLIRTNAYLKLDDTPNVEHIDYGQQDELYKKYLKEYYDESQEDHEW